jgi:hypothetical protein
VKRMRPTCKPHTYENSLHIRDMHAFAPQSLLQRYGFCHRAAQIGFAVDGKLVVCIVLRLRSFLLGDKKDLSFTCVYGSLRLFSYSCCLLFLVSLLVVSPPILRIHLSSRSSAFIPHLTGLGKGPGFSSETHINI